MSPLSSMFELDGVRIISSCQNALVNVSKIKNQKTCGGLSVATMSMNLIPLKSLL